MLLYVLAGVVVALALFLVHVATRPSGFTITRSQRIAAPPERIFAQVADFHAWQAWSPWEGLDPALQRTYAGTPGAVGASYAWSGNAKVGEGSMTLSEVRPASRLAIALEFRRPFPASNQGLFTFAADGDGTLVTWSMSGRNGFMGKLVGRFMDIDRMVGNDFAKGLARLKTVCETGA